MTVPSRGSLCTISAVDNNIIWGMSGAYCQQWIAIRGATCIWTVWWQTLSRNFLVVWCGFGIGIEIGIGFWKFILMLQYKDIHIGQSISTDILDGQFHGRASKSPWCTSYGLFRKRDKICSSLPRAMFGGTGSGRNITCPLGLDFAQSAWQTNSHINKQLNHHRQNCSLIKINCSATL